MRAFTISVLVAIAALVLGMSYFHAFRLADLMTNLTSELAGAILTVVVVKLIAERAEKKWSAGMMSETLFMPLLAVRSLVMDATAFLLADLPPGVEASERWGDAAREMRGKREKLGALIPKEWLLSVVELEDEAGRLDFVTARGEESRRDYARDVLTVWRRYFSIMSHILGSDGKKDLRELLAEPPDFTRLRKRYGLEEASPGR